MESSIAKLNIYWQQAKVMPPIYSLIEEIGPDHSKHFVMQCEFQGQIEHGSGFNKKDAKEVAAGKMLKKLQPIEPPQPQYKIVEASNIEKLFTGDINYITLTIRRREGDVEQFKNFALVNEK
jgi:hypothetical protein